MCPFACPSVICSFHSFVSGCRCPLDIISMYWPPSCCGWTPRVTEGSGQGHERAEGPQRAGRVQRPSFPWWGGGFEAQDPFRHDRYSLQHGQREESMRRVDQHAHACVRSQGCCHYESKCKNVKHRHPSFWEKDLVKHLGKFTCCHNPNSGMSTFFPFNKSQPHLHSRHTLGRVIDTYLAVGRCVPFTSLPNGSQNNRHWKLKGMYLLIRLEGLWQ